MGVIHRVAGGILQRARRVPEYLSMILTGRWEEIRHREALRSWYANPHNGILRFDYPLKPSSVVIDVGGYKGEWAKEIIDRYDPWMYIVEPVPTFYAGIVAMFAGSDKVKVFNCGLLDREVMMPIGIADDATSLYRNGSATVTVQTKDVASFVADNALTSIDLIKINVEGAEYALVRRMIDSGIVNMCRDIQVQFHHVVPGARRKRNALRRRLAETHYLTYDYPYVWENWRRKGLSYSPAWETSGVPGQKSAPTSEPG